MATSEKPLTLPQQTFIDLILQGSSQYEAYRVAYPRSRAWQRQSVDAQANKLAKRPKIAMRLQAAARAMQRKSEITVETITRELAEDRQLAHEAMQASPAVKATELKARIHGILVDRQEVTGKVTHEHVLKEWAKQLPGVDLDALADGDMSVLEGEYEEIED